MGWPRSLVTILSFSYLTCTISQNQRVLQQQPPPLDPREALKENSIIYDVLDDFVPSYAIDITWAAHHDHVDFGNDIPVGNVSDPPSFQFHYISSIGAAGQPTQPPNDTVYTLALTDPDAKSRDDPIWSEMCHWLLTNITYAKALKEDMAPAEFFQYKPPGPPPTTGPHRYVFVLLAGNATDAAKVKAPRDRQHWGYGEVRHGVRKWAGENNLTVIAANFFVAENEEQ